MEEGNVKKYVLLFIISTLMKTSHVVSCCHRHAPIDVVEDAHHLSNMESQPGRREVLSEHYEDGSDNEKYKVPETVMLGSPLRSNVRIVPIPPDGNIIWGVRIIRVGEDDSTPSMTLQNGVYAFVSQLFHYNTIVPHTEA